MKRKKIVKSELCCTPSEMMKVVKISKSLRMRVEKRWRKKRIFIIFIREQAMIIAGPTANQNIGIQDTTRF